MTERSRWDRQQSHFRLIRDCLEGEDAVKDQGQTYVPKPDGMSTTDYAAFLARGAFYAAPEMTLRALTGLALRKAPVIALPTRLEPMRLSATHEGAPLDILIEDAVREVMSMGRFGMLLDFPPGATPLTVPHIATFKAESVKNIRTAYFGGKKVLTNVWLDTEETDEDAGEIKYELALEGGIYHFRRFAWDGTDRVDVGEEIVPTVNGRPLDHIPFVLVSHQGLAPEDVTPPFLALSKAAIHHLVTSCDRRHSLHLTASPTPWIAGSVREDQKPTQIGSGALWLLPEGTQVGLLEPQGLGLSSMKEEQEALVDQMATLGARMLSVTTNRNETIDTATQRTRSELALLHGVVVSVEAAMNRLLRTAAEWVGAPADEASCVLSRDFIESAMDPKAIEAQLKLVNSGQISRETFYENLQAGEIARADRTWADERDMIDAEGGDISATVVTARG